MGNPIQHCPICNAKVPDSSRYPKYICKKCVQKITDKNGRKVYFANSDIYGDGCQGHYDKENKYEGDICFVNGIECYAQAAYFGGIVIQKK